MATLECMAPGVASILDSGLVSDGAASHISQKRITTPERQPQEGQLLLRLMLLPLRFCVCWRDPVDLRDVAVQVDVGDCSDVTSHIKSGSRAPNGNSGV